MKKNRQSYFNCKRTAFADSSKASPTIWSCYANLNIIIVVIPPPPSGGFYNELELAEFIMSLNLADFIMSLNLTDFIMSLNLG